MALRCLLNWAAARFARRFGSDKNLKKTLLKLSLQLQPPACTAWLFLLCECRAAFKPYSNVRVAHTACTSDAAPND